MLKRYFGLDNEERIILKSLGLKDSDLERIEKASFRIVKRNLIVYSIISLVFGIVLGKLF